MKHPFYSNIRKRLQKLVDDTEELRETEDKVYQTCITNVQSTTRIVKKGTRLPLREIAMTFSGMVKYNPRKFAAAIMHVNFGIRVTTCMVFEAGQIVVIGAVTIEHSRYAAQKYRLLLSQVSAIFWDQQRNQLVLTTLENRTCFEEFEIGNIVATSDLPWKIKLKQFRDHMQRDAEYNPDRFPGCSFVVWIKPRQNCQCPRPEHKTKESCACNVQSTLFDSGSFIITGSKSLQDTNRAKHLIIKYTQNHQKLQELVPRKLRFEARREEIFKASMEHNGVQRILKNKDINFQEQRNVDNLIKLQCLLDYIPPVEREKSKLHPLTRACIRRDISVVADLLKLIRKDRGQIIDRVIGELQHFLPVSFVGALCKSLLKLR